MHAIRAQCRLCVIAKHQFPWHIQSNLFLLMPNLDAYQTLLTNNANDDDAQVRIRGNGDLAIRGNGGKITGFLSGNSKTENDNVLADFKQAMIQTYGATATNTAFAQHGLDAKVNNHGPLTLHRMRDAMNTACNECAIQKDLDYKTQYSLHEQQATAWTPNTVASTLTEANHPGLRCHTVESQDMCVHSWHPHNRLADNAFELDEAVRGEMQQLPHLDNQPRIQNLQARLNLLEKMVTQAETNNSANKTNVFTAPEWLFTGMEGTDTHGNPISGGTLTEGEMKKVNEALVQMSQNHPNTVIMPGTILWSKPVDPLINTGGQPLPSDMVFNTAPVVSGGELVHTTYKKNDGGDTSLASIGKNPGGPYEKPSIGNGASARMQVFVKDITNIRPELVSTQNSMRDMMKPDSPERNWEAPLRPPGPPGNSNHMFQCQGKTFAVDICADHGEKEARKEYYGNGPSTQPGSIGDQIKGQGGSDAHIVIAAGNDVKNTSCIAKTGGCLVVNDMNSGLFKLQQVNGQKKNGVGEDIPSVDPPKLRGRDLNSSQQPPSVRRSTSIDLSQSQSQSLSLSQSGSHGLG